jgi:potassium/hydrogen antiporter
MFLIDTVILITGVLLLLGIASSKLSTRLGVPVLVLFLLLGMLAGSEGIGGGSSLRIIRCHMGLEPWPWR